MSNLVYTTCYNKEGYCLHWVQKSKDTIPLLCFGEFCLNEPHTINSKYETKKISKYSNPWTFITDSYSKQIIDDRPKIAINSNTHGNRPTVMTSIIPNKDLREDLLSNIGGDCYSIYSRDIKTHDTYKSYFYISKSKKRKYDQDEYDKIKKNIMIDPVEIIQDINLGYEICLSLGDEPFIDIYYSKVSSNKTIVKTWVEKVYESM